ncbi:lysine N(6)-hydroxylase/L-ornithine N(5)-oxygenase family protein [Loktanella agnita]|uniref:lysine N(6)-hydroxylase/L-ornithine N(5)-oxygenase family protein n=1 Tax=Loktanella agnita TaxID=287097 RepID=UPI00398714DF
MTLLRDTYDILGVGFGPSNLALAIALEERAAAGAAAPKTVFLEAQSSFAWHPNMLLDGTDMQVSFIKDLVSLRNPTSPLSFLSYLHGNGRLERFINRKSFYPSRHEFNDYLSWAAAQMAHLSSYDQRVVGVEPLKKAGGQVDLLSVVSENSRGEQTQRQTRDLVMAIGGHPLIPDVFADVAQSPLVHHSSRYLKEIKSRLAKADRPLKIAVIGSGQSGAEIFYDLVNDPRHPQVDFIFRSHALKPSDDSPFVNEIFDADFTNHVFQQSRARRRDLMTEYSNTNYAVVDGDLIAQIYAVFYEQDVVGSQHYALRRNTEVTSARMHDEKIRLALQDGHHNRSEEQEYDLVILATGFRRRLGETIMADLQHYITGEEAGRTYRLDTTEDFAPRIYLQGYCEDTHGLSDTLLSVLAIRADEIAADILHDHAPGALMMSAAE